LRFSVGISRGKDLLWRAISSHFNLTNLAALRKLTGLNFNLISAELIQLEGLMFQQLIVKLNITIVRF